MKKDPAISVTLARSKWKAVVLKLIDWHHSPTAIEMARDAPSRIIWDEAAWTIARRIRKNDEKSGN